MASRYKRGRMKGTGELSMHAAYDRAVNAYSPEQAAASILVMNFCEFGRRVAEETNDKVTAQLVIEDFILRVGRASRGQSSARVGISPARIACAMEMALWLGAKDVLPGEEFAMQPVYQQPQTAMTFATNDRLKAWDAWVRGSEHKRDATRHLLLRLAEIAR